MTTKPRAQHREFEPDDQFGRTARSPGGIPRNAALARAAAEVEHVKPQVVEHLTYEFRRLEAALAAADAGDDVAGAVTDAYASCQLLRDVAETVGYPLVGLIATNLCTIFETVQTVGIAYPQAVIDCHRNAMRLALTRRYKGMSSKDLPELSAGLQQIVQIARSMGAGTDTMPPDPSPT